MPDAGQGSGDEGVTIPLLESAGQHDYHLTRRLLASSAQHGIPTHRDVFRFYHCDASTAVSTGGGVATAPSSRAR